MLFPTPEFALFFLLVFPAGWALAGRPRAWKWFMVAASYVFYGFWDVRFVALIALSSLVNAWLARAVRARRGGDDRWVVAVAAAFNLGVLGAFKYYGFFAESVNAVLHEMGMSGHVPLVELVLPVGISFFTFQALSYVIDVRRGVFDPVPTLDFAVYLSFFPHVVAGPIVRAREFVPQLHARRDLAADDVGRALWMFAGGFFKKVVVSSFVATAIVDPVFAVPGAHSAPEIIAAIYGYALQIYADFSGYTDMAIAVALLLGIRFPANFDRPYAATSVGDFWRRWHMTLSRWLRDYLYIPLGGSRRGTLRTYGNLLATMALGGLWHGAALTFVAWGLVHGAALAIERAGRDARDGIGRARRRSEPASSSVAGASSAATSAATSGTRPDEASLAAPAVEPGDPVAAISSSRASRAIPHRVGSALKWFMTFHFVALAWVPFRAETFEAAGAMLARAVTAWGPAPLVTPALVAVIAVCLALQLVPRRFADRLELAFVRLPLPAQSVAFGTVLALALTLGPEGVAPFIYFQF